MIDSDGHVVGQIECPECGAKIVSRRSVAEEREEWRPIYSNLRHEVDTLKGAMKQLIGRAWEASVAMEGHNIEPKLRAELDEAIRSATTQPEKESGCEQVEGGWSCSGIEERLEAEAAAIYVGPLRARIEALIGKWTDAARKAEREPAQKGCGRAASFYVAASNLRDLLEDSGPNRCYRCDDHRYAPCEKASCPRKQQAADCSQPEPSSGGPGKCTCEEASPDRLVIHRSDGPCYLRPRPDCSQPETPSEEKP